MPDYWHNNEDDDESVVPQFCEDVSVIDEDDEESEG